MPGSHRARRGRKPVGSRLSVVGYRELRALQVLQNAIVSRKYFRHPIWLDSRVESKVGSPTYDKSATVPRTNQRLSCEYVIIHSANRVTYYVWT